MASRTNRPRFLDSFAFVLGASVAIAACGGSDGGVVWVDANGDEVRMLERGVFVDDEGYVWAVNIETGEIKAAITNPEKHWQSADCTGAEYTFLFTPPRYTVTDDATYRVRRDDQQTSKIGLCSRRGGENDSCRELSSGCMMSDALAIAEMEDIGSDKPADRPGPLHPEVRD